MLPIPCFLQYFDTLTLSLKAMKSILESTTFNTDAMLNSVKMGYTSASELADWLVMNLILPFRDAHYGTDTIVKIAETKGCKLDEIDLIDTQEVNLSITVTEDTYSVLTI